MGTSEEMFGAVDWLREAAEVVRRFARHATLRPWWWGDSDIASNVGEVQPSLRDPLDDLLEDSLNSVYAYAHANARWIILARVVAEPLAALLDALAQTAEQTLAAGGSISGEPYRSALVLAQRIIEDAENSSPVL